jgi:hypothetical protein
MGHFRAQPGAKACGPFEAGSDFVASPCLAPRQGAMQACRCVFVRALRVLGMCVCVRCSRVVCACIARARYTYVSRWSGFMGS